MGGDDHQWLASQKYTLNGFHPGGSLGMQVSGQFRANVLMHFWRAGVHVRQLVVVFSQWNLPCAMAAPSRLEFTERTGPALLKPVHPDGQMTGASAEHVSSEGLDKAGPAVVVLASREYVVKRKNRIVAGSRPDAAKPSAQAQREEMAANVEIGIEDLPVWKEYVQRFGLEEARKILRRGLLINQLTGGNPRN